MVFPYINALHSYVIFMLFLAKSANTRHANENAGRRDREHAQYLQDAVSSSPPPELLMISQRDNAGSCPQDFARQTLSPGSK